jgi:hypothetical protein
MEPGRQEITLSLHRSLMDVLFAAFVFMISSIAASVIGIVWWGLARKRIRLEDSVSYSVL